MDQILETAPDILLAIAAIGASIYCYILARRLKRFNNLENGVGGAVAVLSAQVDDMTRTLDHARKAASHSSQTLTALTERAEHSARRLELMMASLHDLPDLEDPREPAKEEAERDREWGAIEKHGANGDGSPALMFATRRANALEAK